MQQDGTAAAIADKLVARGVPKQDIVLAYHGPHVRQYTDTALSYYLGIEWVRGEDFLAVYDGEYTRSTPHPETVIKQLLQRLQWAANNVDSPTGKLPILLTANAVTLLWGTVAMALNGKQILEKSSPWSDKIGK